MVLTDVYFFIFFYIILILLIYFFLKRSNIQRNHVVKYLIITFLISVFVGLVASYLIEHTVICEPGVSCRPDTLNYILREFDDLLVVHMSLFLILMLIISIVKYFRRTI